MYYLGTELILVDVRSDFWEFSNLTVECRTECLENEVAV